MSTYPDEIDFEILFHLQKNARITNREMSAKVHLSQNAVAGRIKRLEERGYISNYITVLNKSKVNKKLISFTGVRLNINGKNCLSVFFETVKSIPEVINCYHVNGIFDFILHIVVSDMEEYHNCLVNTLLKIGNIGDVRTFFVLKEMRDENIIDLTNLLRRHPRKPN